VRWTKSLNLLSRRTIGWIFNATIRINLLWSLTKADDAAKNTYGIVLSVFSDILGYEYPIDVKTFIKTIQSNENNNELNGLCDEILRAIDTYAANLHRLAPVKEFHSLHEKYRILRKAREKEISKAQEEANKNSIILQLVSRVAVKAGTGSFSRLPDGRGYSARLPFTTYETSITLPRSTVTNNVGNELELILYRNSKRVNNENGDTRIPPHAQVSGELDNYCRIVAQNGLFHPAKPRKVYRQGGVILRSLQRHFWT
jgi:hypothetical protein